MFLQKLKIYIFQNKLALSLSLLMTILVLSPVWSFPLIAKSNYKGINIAHFEKDAHLYLSRAREVFDGNPTGNWVLREGKDRQDHFFSYNEIVLLMPLRWIGISKYLNIVNVYHFYNFIGVFIILLLIYHLALKLSSDKYISIATAIFVVGGYQIIYTKSFFYSDFNIYGRTMFPYVASLMFFIYLNTLIWATLYSNYKKILVAGVAFGLLFYVYFFAWSFALAINGSFFLIYLILRKWDKVFLIIKISIIGLAIGSYNLFKMFVFFGSEAGKQASYFHWTSHGHHGIMSKIGLATLFLWFIFIFFKRNDKNKYIILSIIGAIWISLNQQILTGTYIQVGHYYWYFIVPVSVVVSFYMLWKILPKDFYRKFFVFLTIFLAFFNTAVGQWKSILTTVDIKIYEQNYKPVIDILNNEKSPGVILTSDDLFAYLFTIYTPHDLFWHYAAAQTDTPISRFKDAFFVYMFLNRESRTNLEEYIDTIMDDPKIDNFYKYTYRHIEGYASGLDYYTYTDMMNKKDDAILSKRSDVLGPLSDTFRELKKNVGQGILGVLDKYGVNYIVWNKDLYPEWDLSFISNKEELLTYKGIVVYKIN